MKIEVLTQIIHFSFKLGSVTVASYCIAILHFRCHFSSISARRLFPPIYTVDDVIFIPIFMKLNLV